MNLTYRHNGEIWLNEANDLTGGLVVSRDRKSEDCVSFNNKDLRKALSQISAFVRADRAVEYTNNPNLSLN